jgi:hypothetical protein
MQYLLPHPINSSISPEEDTPRHSARAGSNKNGVKESADRAPVAKTRH